MGFAEVAGATAPIVDSLVNLIGTGITNKRNEENVKATNATNLQIARETNQAQIDLANTAVQRRAADLEAAGYNRLLAAMGDGASTPSLQSASMQSFQANNMLQSNFQGAFGNALELARYRREKEMQQEEIKRIRKEQESLDANIEKAKADAAKANSETNLNNLSYNVQLLDQEDFAEFKTEQRALELKRLELLNEGVEKDNALKQPDSYAAKEYGYSKPESALGKIVHDFANYWGVMNEEQIKLREEKKAEKEAKKAEKEAKKQEEKEAKEKKKARDKRIKESKKRIKQAEKDWWRQWD